MKDFFTGLGIGTVVLNIVLNIIIVFVVPDSTRKAQIFLIGVGLISAGIGLCLKRKRL